MDFDFKITTWERVTVPKKNEAEVLAGIKGGTITSANDIFDLITSYANCEKLVDSDEQMTLEDNGGCSTIEVLDDEGETIFTNGE